MYYILENKDYTIKLFWTALAVAVNADDIRGSASRLAVSRNKALVGSMEQVAEIIPVWQYLSPWYG